MSAARNASLLLLTHYPDPPFLISKPSTFQQAVTQAKAIYFLPSETSVLLLMTVAGTKIAVTSSCWERFEKIVDGGDPVELEVKEFDKFGEMGRRMREQQEKESVADLGVVTRDPTALTIPEVFEEFPIVGRNGQRSATLDAAGNGSAGTGSGATEPWKLILVFSCSLLDLYYKIDPKVVTAQQLADEIQIRRPFHDVSACKCGLQANATNIASCPVFSADIELNWKQYCLGPVDQRSQTLYQTIDGLRQRFPADLGVEDEKLQKDGLVIHVVEC